MTLGKRLRRFRDKFGYSRETAAHMLGVSFSSLEKWETDKRKPTLAKLQKLAQLYGVDVSSLVGDTLSKKGVDAELLELAAEYKEILMAFESMDEDVLKKLTSRIFAVAQTFPREDARKANISTASSLQVKKLSENG